MRLPTALHRRIHAFARTRLHTHAHTPSTTRRWLGGVVATIGVSSLVYYQYTTSTSAAQCVASTGETSTSVRSFLGPVTATSPSDRTSALTLDQLATLYAPSRDASTILPFAYPHYDYNVSPPLLFTQSSSSSGLHQSMEKLLRGTQSIICQHILNIEGGNTAFREDVTVRPDGSGGGVARIIQNGTVFQKAGVNVSVANVRLPYNKLKDMADDHSELTQLISINDFNRKQYRLTGDSARYPVINDNDLVTRFTASLSLVIHPINPFAPTSHANYRYFEFTLPDNRTIAWFAGGSDLTPAYVNSDDSRYFHRTLKTVCDMHDASYYPRFKRWCDRYFTIKHRQESRGVGGIFFDDLMVTNDNDRRRYYDLIRDCAQTFSQSYFPLILKHGNQSFTRRHYDWQQLRRSRYVEFNLMYDKGTSYGLAQTNARPEAILMSLPLTCRFEYKPAIQAGSEEEKTLDVLRTPREWV